MDSFTIPNIVKLLLPLLFFFVQFIITLGSHAELMPVHELSTGTLQPMGLTEYRMVEAHDSHDARRRLAPFQLCLLCKCCAAAATTSCTTMPCCFGIDCQLPNKPYGVCAFVPKKCDCISCAV
ncbi:uncharacterized protein LOC133872827 [Alnus glutinosa]|uniref:uncharacterized protein LOC133872827 n=1 Tax=Alnus glutinosa TaxID=3517 RepID=UPI002D792105|nr:uncharacterized protein LOC133872827 [Alnus glutinosa]